MNNKITDDQLEEFNNSAKFRSKLICKFNEGFFLLKLRKQTAFRYRYTDSEGKRKEITLGSYPSISLNEAYKKYNLLKINKTKFDGFCSSGGMEHGDMDLLAELVAEKIYKKIGIRLENIEMTMGIIDGREVF